VNLKAPYPAFFDRCFESLAMVPKNYIEKVGDEGFAAQPVGTGPFRIVRFTRDLLFEVEAVENHYRKTPYIKRFIHRIVPEHSTRMAMIQTGEADMVALTPVHIPLVERDPKLRVLYGQHTYLLSLIFFDLAFPEDSPFKDPRVRKATSLAIDREGIAAAMGHGAWETWGSFQGPYMPGYDPARKPDPFDPEKAKKLLAEAGYAKGFDTVLTTNPPTKERFEAIQQQLADVGIRAKLEVPEHGTWARTFVGGNFRGFGYAPGPWWAGRTHPYVAIESHTIGTWSHNLATPEVKQAMDKLLQAIDQGSIAKLAREVDELLLEQMVRVPLWSIHMPFAVNERIVDFPGVPGVLFPLGFEYMKVKD